MQLRHFLVCLAAFGIGLASSPDALAAGGDWASPHGAPWFAGEEIEPYTRAPSETRPYAVCPAPTRRRASCMAAVVPTHHGEPIVGPNLEGSGVDGGFSPADLHSAYDLPTLGGSGLTVAVTIAYDNPNAEADLAVYRNQYGLPPCTTANGCFKKVNQRGEAKNYPQPNADWGLETSLDLDMVSAVCPQCNILLVEADSNFLDDMGSAVEQAAEMGATVISNSWATEEFGGETYANPYFDHPGIPTLFATGDWGYGTYYPAASPDVIAVGGTSLWKSNSARGWTETAWSGAGSGCSPYQEKPAWQVDTGCDGRTIADVSAVADTSTPVSVYDTYEQPGWTLLGGTSVATPILAGVEALSSAGFRSAGPSAFTRAGNADGLFDVTEGENGLCASVSDSDFSATYLCQADVGFDGPSGWGTPDGPLSLPVAITEPATVTAVDEATLHGAIDPRGLTTDYRFEYGETESYGSSVPIPDGSVSPASGYIEVARTIDGLEARTPYHYRIVADNAAGTFPGIDRTFGTTPPAATTGAADEIGASGATLHAAVDPEGLATRYYFEYGPDSTYGLKQPVRAGELGAGTGEVQVNAAIDALAGDQTYHYRVVAKNVAGMTQGKDRVFTTEAPKWTARHLPQPPNSGNGYATYGVSCMRSDECVAVGEKFDLDLGADVTLAERWDGESWVAMGTPNPTGLEEGWKFGWYAALRDVSCVSASDCVAVGHYKASDDATRPLIESWNGTEWSLLSPFPAGALAAGLHGVSCSSPTACTAIGYLETSTGTIETLAQRWNGIEWIDQPMPNPADAAASRLSGVSCPSSTSCVAVGTYETASGAENTLAEHWDGNDWTIQPMPADPGGRSSARLEGISCNSATACMAVGYFQGSPSVQTLAEQWDGNDWTISPTPTPLSEGILYGVSCTEPNACTAAGTYYSPLEFDHGSRSLVERWGGAAWSVLEAEEPPAPPGWWHESWLHSVSCPPGEGCTAVGYSLGAPSGGLAPTRAFAEHEADPQPPSAAFSASSDSTTVGRPVEFDAAFSSDPDGAIESYDWDFGDGEHGAGVEVSHSYAHAGSYLVALSVTDDDGQTGEVAHLVRVTDPGPGSPSPDPPSRLADSFLIRDVAVRCDGRILLTLVAPGSGAFSATAKTNARPPARKGGAAKRPSGCGAGPTYETRFRFAQPGGGPAVTYGKGKTRASAEGHLRLTILPLKQALHLVIRPDSVRIEISVTFRPVGGNPSTKTLIARRTPIR